jgi:ribosomal peptide maturation radical SAM protein 1
LAVAAHILIMPARRPFKIILIQMPFGSLAQPALGLLQLQAVVRRSLGDACETEIVYISHDFANYLGMSLYTRITYADSNLRFGPMSGLGDWFFRHVAFPELPDNTEGYRDTFFSGADATGFVDIEAVLKPRPHIATLLEAMIHKYDLPSADLIGFTSMFMQNTACIAMARLLKQRSTSPRIVVGGPNCEGPMGQALADQVPYYDAVFSGPGLQSFPEYVRACIDERAESTLATRGILTRGQAQAPRSTTAVSHDNLGEELDINTPLALDYTAFLDTFDRAFNRQVQPVLTFETSRGCWWGAKAHCPFCGLNGSTMAFRAMTPPAAVALFEELYQYSSRCSLFECVDNIMPSEYPDVVFPHITPPDGVSVFYEVKADVTAHDLESMSRAGVTRIQPGIEALATRSLKALKKGTTACGNVALLKNCITYGVTPLWNFLIGIPREEQPDAVYAKYAQEIPKLHHLPPPWAVFKVRVDRFSPYFMQPHLYGLALQPKAFYRFVYPFDDQALFNLAYYFDDEHAGTAEYADAATTWQPILHGLIRTWNQVWHVQDIAARPALFVQRRGTRYHLHDSRNGEVVERDVCPHTFEALKLLVNPTRLADVHEQLDAAGCTDAGGIIDELRADGMLFEEGDRVIGLAHVGARPLLHAPRPGLRA